MRSSATPALWTALVLLGVSPSLAAGTHDRQIVLTFDDLPAQRAQSQPQARIVEITDVCSRDVPPTADK